MDAENFDDVLLESLWDKADWCNLESELFEMQRAIALAAKGGDRDAIRIYQRRLTQSNAAKMLAVRHVSENHGTPGIDGVRWNTSCDRMKAALSLKDEGYRALPMKLVVIYSKFSRKERHLKIPVYHDRAMQTLHAYSLMPVAETLGDRRSFAFRKNRSTQDAHAYILSALKKNGNYVVKADVKSCYASINHDWLLNNIPMNTAVLREFLKAGHVAAGEFFPPEDRGISLGVSISPILGNMALDGLQNTIFENLHGLRYDEEYSDGHLVRFADDIFVTAHTSERSKKIIAIIERFLRQRGMQLSIEKTSIINVCQGFDFLSRHYFRSGSIIMSHPSDNAVLKMEHSLRDLILPFNGSQNNLIEKLNKKLYGWATYHRITDAKSAFRHIDVVVKTLLLQLCERLHPSWTRKKIIDHYFFLDHSGKYVYALHNKKDVRVICLAETVLIEHIPKNINPYIDADDEEKESRKIHNVIGKYKAIWNRQDGKCYYCGTKMHPDQKKTIVHMYKAIVHGIKHLAYIHAECEQHEIEFIETEEFICNDEDTFDVIKSLSQKHTKQRLYSKFSLLTKYFQRKTEAVFTLNFDEISKIAGVKLCKSAITTNGYWHNKGRGNISESWLSKGYTIKYLDLKNQRIVFARTCKNLPVQIPEVFMNGRVPKNAKIELESFFDYLMKKYGI